MTKNLTIRLPLVVKRRLDKLQIFIQSDEGYITTRNNTFLEAIWIVLQRYRELYDSNDDRLQGKPYRYNFKLPLEAQDDFEELRLLMGERTNNGCAIRAINEALKIYQGEM